MRARKVQSFRVKDKLWEDFKQKVTEQGFSTCFILETLIQAYIKKPKTYYKSSSITVNQNIVYEVAKSRRRKGGRIKVAENCYLNGMWTYRRPEVGEPLTKLGHVLECVCLKCKPHKSNRLKRQWNPTITLGKV